jgi:hypothetical protein
MAYVDIQVAIVVHVRHGTPVGPHVRPRQAHSLAGLLEGEIPAIMIEAVVPGTTADKDIRPVIPIDVADGHPTRRHAGGMVQVPLRMIIIDGVEDLPEPPRDAIVQIASTGA